MRFFFACFALLCASFAADAGEISFRQNQTRWLTTSCQEPAKPTLSQGGAEAQNANTQAINAYAANLDQYLKCLGDEAGRDLAAVGQGVNQQLANVSAQAQAAVAELYNQAGGMRAP